MDNPWYPFGLFCDKVEGIEPKWHQHSLTKTWIEEPKGKKVRIEIGLDIIIINDYFIYDSNRINQ